MEVSLECRGGREGDETDRGFPGWYVRSIAGRGWYRYDRQSAGERDNRSNRLLPDLDQPVFGDCDEVQRVVLTLESAGGDGRVGRALDEGSFSFRGNGRDRLISE